MKNIKKMWKVRKLERKFIVRFYKHVGRNKKLRNITYKLLSCENQVGDMIAHTSTTKCHFGSTMVEML
jgi:hypothetical protein